MNYVDILRKANNINDFKIVIKHTTSYELFYVLDKLETTRVEDVDDVNISIYVDKESEQGKLRGTADFTVYPYMKEEDILNKVNENVPNALFSLNKFYPLVSPQDRDIVKVESNLSNKSFKELAKEVVDTFFSIKLEEGLSNNATEFFLYKIDTHIVNSKGVDLSSTSYKLNIEMIPTFTGKKQSVEVYFMLEAGELNKEDLIRQVKEQLALAKARYYAEPLKIEGDIDVIIEGEENIAQLMMYYLQDLSYQMNYMHMNRFKLGDKIQGDVKGDKITITLTPTLKGACNASSIDKDGVILEDITIVKDGVAVANHGDYKFGYYLGVNNPTGDIRVFSLNEGSVKDEDLKKKPYLRCVKFSGIQMEANSGFFGGEVRLGYYFDGEKEIPVTGFSVTGNMHEEKETMLMAKSTFTGANYHGPKYLIFKGMKVA